MTKQTMMVLAVAAAMSLPAGTTQAYPQGAVRHKKGAKVKPSATQEEMREMRAMQGKLQAEIDELKQMLMDRDAKLTGATQAVQEAQTEAAAANAKVAETSSSVMQEDERVKDIQAQVNDQQVATAAAVKTVSESQAKLAAAVESPATLHYKGVTITPIGFFAAESVYRSRSLNSDINTPFNTTPYPGAAEAHTSEFNLTGRQSRLGVLVAGTVPFGKLGGYFEGDFLSAGVTSNNNQSNSYTMRQRQFFGQVALNKGFTFTGGQMWSLVTETAKGTDNRTEVLPQTPDAAYHVGFSWARQPGVRFSQKVGIATYAMSLEEAQYIFSASNANNNFFFGSAGVGGGLYNLNANYSNNVAPDVIVKAAFDPKYGHFEVGGIARFFRDRYYPGNTSAASIPASAASNDTEVGGGFFANAHVPMTKYFTLGLHAMQGTGVGRYGTSTLPDVTVHPDGRLAPIRSSQGLLSLEFHANPKLDLYGYAGGEYAQRTTYRDPVSGKLVGYAPITNINSGCNTETTPGGTSGYLPGVPANCAGNTRALIEGSAGFLYRFYNGPKGRVQYSMIYSYLNREAWTGTAGAGVAAPKGTNNMVFTSFRYYIP